MIPYFTVPPLDLGGVSIYPFSLCLLMGWVCSGGVATALAIRRGSVVPPLVAFAALPVVGLPFAHALYLLAYAPEELFVPASLLNVTAGFVGVGAVVATVSLAVASGVIVARDRIWPTLDAVVVGQLVLWWFHRLGCTIVHDHPGIETDFVLGVQGICLQDGSFGQSGLDSLACHDLGMYEWMLAGLCLAIVAVARLSGRVPDGRLVLVPLLLYPPFRWAMYALDALPPAPLYLGLETVLLAVGLGAAVAVLSGRTRAASERPTPR